MYLSNDLGIRLQLDQAFREASGVCMIVCFSKVVNRTSQGNLQMGRLQLTVREVGSQFQIACHVGRIFSCHSSTLHLLCWLTIHCSLGLLVPASPLIQPDLSSVKWLSKKTTWCSRLVCQDCDQYLYQTHITSHSRPARSHPCASPKSGRGGCQRRSSK